MTEKGVNTILIYGTGALVLGITGNFLYKKWKAGKATTENVTVGGGGGGIIEKTQTTTVSKPNLLTAIINKPVGTSTQPLNVPMPTTRPATTTSTATISPTSRAIGDLRSADGTTYETDPEFYARMGKQVI